MCVCGVGGTRHLSTVTSLSVPVQNRRGWYSDWYNSTSFAEFSRKWNKPVHEWLLRHVYLDAMRRRGLSPTAALYLTFTVSILAHEVIIWGTLGLVTPYLAILSATQVRLI